jgi:uncharacterized protein DUF6438
MSGTESEGGDATGRCARRRIGVSWLAMCFAVTALSHSATGSEDGLRVTLERTACFGTCPIYSVSVDESGTITYVGDRFVAEHGSRKAKLSIEDMRRLVAAIDKAAFDDFEGPYVRGTQGCEDYYTDHPTQIITVARSGHEKRVVYDFGCNEPGVRNTFARLKALGTSIDEILDTMRWVGAPGDEHE